MAELQIAENQQVDEIFAELKAGVPYMLSTGATERISLLKKLLRSIIANRYSMQQALLADYGRSPEETDLADTWVIIKELKFAIRHLRGWMRPKNVPTPLPFVGSSSSIKYQGKGVVLILSPWNFPFNLSFSPLISAIAAGNTVLIKPSEHTPNSAALIEKIVAEVFPKNLVRVLQGGVLLSQKLLKLPFNHIFFTGSPTIGMVVMKAAAENLASVTLELGGKSPTIVHRDVNLKQTAKQVAYSKFSNSGQVCIATDYLFVHKSIAPDFINALNAAIQTIYPNLSAHENADYARIVNQNHALRIDKLRTDAQRKGAQLIHASAANNPSERFIAPTLLADISAEMDISETEIFGPILPIKTYENIEDVLLILQDEAPPLALHIFTKNKKLAQNIIDNTRSGAVLVNETFIHHFNSHLPFGGVNKSGIGKSHGYFGFLEFSNQKAVVKHHLPWQPSSLLHPPYTNFSKWLVNLLLRWF